MKNHNSNKPLISFHIPKCAGTSFSDILDIWFGHRLLLNYYNEKTNTAPIRHNLYTDEIKNNFKPKLCIHGHFNNARNNSAYDYYPESKQFITILRNPFDVHVSTYFYVKREETTQGFGAYRNGQPHKIVANKWNLEDYLTETKKSYFCNFLPSYISLENYKDVLEKEFIFVGTVEHIQFSINLLARKLSFPTINVPQKNISKWTEDIPKGAITEFISNNLLEMSIYNYAKNKIRVMTNV